MFWLRLLLCLNPLNVHKLTGDEFNIGVANEMQVVSILRLWTLCKSVTDRPLFVSFEDACYHNPAGILEPFLMVEQRCSSRLVCMGVVVVVA